MALSLQLSSPFRAAAPGVSQPSRHGCRAQPLCSAPAARRQAAAAMQRQRRQLARAAADPAGSPSSEEEFEGLLPEEDAEIPGTYRDAMTTNTPLGKAVKGACDELDALGGLERQTLEEAEALLKKLGFKGSLFAAPEAQAQQQEPSGGGQE